MRSSAIKNAEREVSRAEAEVAAEQAHVDQLRARLTPVVEHAIHLARQRAAHAAVTAGQARDWAAPHVGAAAERVAPAMDAARDRVIDDLLPRMIDAVHQAAHVGAAARTAASRTVEDAALSLAAATPTAKARARRHRRRTRAVLITLAGALVSALAAAVVVRRVKTRQASWELAPTDVATDERTGRDEPGQESAASGSTMDMIAAAAGPSDAGVVSGPPLGEPDKPVDPVAPLGSAPSSGVDAEPPAKPSEHQRDSSGSRNSR